MNTFRIECWDDVELTVEAVRIWTEGDFFLFVDEDDEPLLILVATQVISITKQKGETK